MRLNNIFAKLTYDIELIFFTFYNSKLIGLLRNKNSVLESFSASKNEDKFFDIIFCLYF